MDNRCFKLKRSYVALAFQLSIFAVLMAVLYQLLPFMLWTVFLVLGVVVYVLFYNKQPKIAQFEYLEGREWSVTDLSEQTQRVSLSHVVDHQAYIVVYFQHFKAKPLLIWCDQVPLKQWKSLKKMTRLN